MEEVEEEEEEDVEEPAGEKWWDANNFGVTTSTPMMPPPPHLEGKWVVLRGEQVSPYPKNGPKHGQMWSQVVANRPLHEGSGKLVLAREALPRYRRLGKVAVNEPSAIGMEVYFSP